MATVGLPLTGAGDATAQVAVDLIGGAVYQRVKLMDGLEGSTIAMIAKVTTPGATDAGMVVRNIPSSGLVQLVAGAVDLTSAGSSKVVGTVNVASGVVLGGSTAAIGQLTSGSQTIGTVNLSSEGSTKVTGTVNLTSGSVLGPSTAATGQVSSGTQTIGTVQLASAGTTGSIGSVALLGGSSNNIIGAVALIAGASDNEVGGVNLTSGSTAFVAGAVVVAPGSSANMVGTVVLSSGTTAITAGAVALLAGSSANTVGAVAQGAGSSASPWGVNQQAASTAVRSSIATSVDVALLSSNTARLGAIIWNESSASALYVGFSTVAVSSGSYSYKIGSSAGLIIGQGQIPNYVGMIRGRLESTALAGVARMTEFT